MAINRRTFGIGAGAALALPALAKAASGTITVAYAGSMGVLMNRGLGPEFEKQTHITYRGIGQGAFALARLIAGKTMHADVFVSITPGPIRVLQKAGLVGHAVPVASTAMVIAYSPKSRFAPQLEAAASGKTKWYDVLESKGLRFGRTDPRTDPQGRNILFTFDLAEKFYHQPGLAKRVLGAPINPRQIFTEPSLLARLDAGELDATSGYESAVKSLKLPFIPLPKEINLSDPAMVEPWYSKAAVTLDLKGKTKVLHTEPLVFYACVPKDAPNPDAGRAFIALMQSKAGQDLFARYGYNPPQGGAI
ncbi:extracellular solute-binding protein [Acidiphilium sp. AL]|uniref:Extracellular solute-binding protein n=1 Tax=Acidiphilium iwatense TaxID=768198 RepID=A0ABS9DW23_9PROT|nr:MULTISPECIES: extracellular solute-binding protein [Acidiphilium]MCF3946933.1 extracellular solute-binding protein [Acidiphilium iwatense]MCU4159762.1 extracellular solute-binding protein [Acidiphilium sp. AL]